MQRISNSDENFTSNLPDILMRIDELQEDDIMR